MKKYLISINKYNNDDPDMNCGYPLGIASSLEKANALVDLWVELSKGKFTELTRNKPMYTATEEQIKAKGEEKEIGDNRVYKGISDTGEHWLMVIIIEPMTEDVLTNC